MSPTLAMLFTGRYTSFANICMPFDKIIAELLSTNDNIKKKWCIEKLLDKNKEFIHQPIKFSYQKFANDWLKKYFAHETNVSLGIKASYTGIFYLANIHPSRNIELCVEVDDGILFFNLDGVLLGKVLTPGRSYVSNIEAIPEPENSTKESLNNENKLQQILYSWQEEGKEEVVIIRYINEEYRIVFNKKFNISKSNFCFSHPLRELVFECHQNGKDYLGTNDEGIYKLYEYNNGVYVLSEAKIE